jgi:hypothetical protein
MAAWARSERTHLSNRCAWMGRFWSLSSAPYFLADCAGLTLYPSKLRVNKSVGATALYLADEGSGVVAELTSRNQACVVSPGA